MKTTIDKDFFEKWQDQFVVMHCKTEKQAETFCKIMHENGLSWQTEGNYLETTHWDKYKEDTCYNFNKGTCASLEFYKETYLILEFEDYIISDDEHVDHPSHYNIGNIEVIDVIEDWNLNFNLGNVIKYVSRCEYKDNKIEDLEKAKWYLQREIERGMK